MTTRREFLRSSAGAAAALGVTSMCGGCAWFNKKDVQLEAPANATEVTLPLDKYPALRDPNGFVRVEAKDGDLRLIILRKPDGTLVAASMVCTHWGCDVDWDKQAARFDIPCHGSKFDATGKVLEGPADEPLPTYPVEETTDGIVVRFG